MTVPEIRVADPPYADDETQPAVAQETTPHVYLIWMVLLHALPDDAGTEWSIWFTCGVAADEAAAMAEALEHQPELLPGWTADDPRVQQIPDDWLLDAAAIIHPDRVTLAPA